MVCAYSAFTSFGRGDYYTLDDTGKVIDTDALRTRGNSKNIFEC